MPRSPVLTAPPRETRAPVDQWDDEMVALLREERRGVQLRQLQVLRDPLTGATRGAPAPSTVAEQVAVGSTLATMAQTAVSIAQKQGEADRQRAERAEDAAAERAGTAVEAERQRHRDTLDYLERIDKARREADEARRAAEEARQQAERDRLADRIEHMEEKYGDIVDRLEARATAAEQKVASLQADIRGRKSGLEELIEAAGEGNIEGHHLVRVVRALAPGPQQDLLGPDGQPLNPDLRFRSGMADVLVERERKKTDVADRAIGLVEGIYGDVRDFFGLRGPGPAGGGARELAAQMSQEGDGGDA